jgi:hypothetical protein
VGIALNRPATSEVWRADIAAWAPSRIETLNRIACQEPDVVFGQNQAAPAEDRGGPEQLSDAG